MKLEPQTAKGGTPLARVFKSPLPPRPSAPEAGPEEGDRYVSDTPPPPLRPSRISTRYRKALLGLTLALSSGTAYAAVPGAGQVTQQLQEKQNQDAKAEAAMSKEADATLATLKNDDMHQPGLRCTDSEPACQARLATLPDAAQREYREMPLGVKRMMNEKINAKTTVIPVVFVINHRKAFLKGEALGRNVFDFIEKKTEGMAREGKLKPEHFQRVKRFLDTSRTLTPQQRETLVDLITRDVQLNAKK